MVILDLEWNRGYDNTPLDEILQIGAVRVEYLGGPVTGTFNAYIRPAVHKKFDLGAKQLPDLRMSQESELDFVTALEMFRTWCGAETEYTPSSEVVRLTNTINRELEHPDKPEDVVALVLQGVSARYDCCSAPTEYDTPSRLTEVDFKHFGRAVSHIVIAEDSSVTIQFK